MAWLCMFLGSLLSGYVLIRAGSTEWSAHAGHVLPTIVGSGLLLAAAVACRPDRAALVKAAVAAGALVGWLARLHGTTFLAGHTPASHLEFASWFTITGVLLTLIAGLAVATLALAFGEKARLPGRAAGLRVIYGALSLLWFVALSAFSRA